MYAPYRILPFDHETSRVFEEEIALNCCDIKPFTPETLILRFEGESDIDLEYVKKYTLKFTKDFAVKEEDGSLTVYHNTLFDQELIVPDQTFEFTLPTLIKGACYQVLGERILHPYTHHNHSNSWRKLTRSTLLTPFHKGCLRGFIRDEDAL